MIDRKASFSPIFDNKSNLPRAVSLSLFHEQGSPFDSFPLYAELYFGDQDVIDEDIGFNIRFKRAILRLKMERAQIKRNPPRLERVLEADQFSQVMKQILKNQASVEGHAEAGLGTSLAGILKYIGIDLKLSGLVKWESDKSKQSELESRSIYSIVQPIGDDSWQIGHEIIGDPTKIDGHLIGEYLRSKSGDQELALCHLEPLRRRRTFEYLAEVSVSFRDCEYRPIGENAPSGKTWQDNNKLKIEKAMQLISIRNDQVAVGLRPFPGEFVICQSGYKIRLAR